MQNVRKLQRCFKLIVEKVYSLFKVVNDPLDKQKVRALPEHTDPKALADEFNDYYIDEVKKL